MNIKMRVMIYSKKGQMKTYADAIGQATGCLVSDIPPAYPCEKEKLVLIGFSAGAKADDVLTRFCSLLSPDRALNVALYIDGKPDSEAERQVISTLKAAGTNVLPDTYYPKCGMFGKSISIENRQAIIDWVRSIEAKLTQK